MKTPGGGGGSKWQEWAGWEEKKRGNESFGSKDQNEILKPVWKVQYRANHPTKRTKEKTTMFYSEGFNFKNLEKEIDSFDPVYIKYVPQP